MQQRARLFFVEYGSGCVCFLNHIGVASINFLVRLAAELICVLSRA